VKVSQVGRYCEPSQPPTAYTLPCSTVAESDERCKQTNRSAWRRDALLIAATLLPHCVATTKKAVPCCAFLCRKWSGEHIGVCVRARGQRRQ
jgi:hypothetical protein